MSGFSTTDENLVLDAACGGLAYAPGSPLYLALVTVTVTAGMTGATITETDYGSYARVAVASTVWNAAAGGVKSNATAVAFPQSTTPSANPVVGWALCSTAGIGTGVVHFAGNIVPSVTISTAYTPTFLGGTPGQLVLTLSQGT